MRVKTAAAKKEPGVPKKKLDVAKKRVGKVERVQGMSSGEA